MKTLLSKIYYMPCYTCNTCVCKVLTAANHIVHTVWLEMLVVVLTEIAFLQS